MKKPDLSSVVAAAGSTRRTRPDPEAQTAAVAEESKVRTRVATRQIAGHFPEEVSWQLRELAAERRTTVQNLLSEALNELFRRYGKPELAPINAGKRGRG